MSRGAPPSPAAVLLARVVLFKLMLFAGLVKLWSGDPTWADWTALTWHYQTQPLPNPVSWWAHHLPRDVHRLSAGLMFAVELILPFGLWLGRPGRVVFFVGTDRAVAWPGPHLPRLEWHLWFTALAPCEARRTCFVDCSSDPVLGGLVDGVLEQRPAVLGLLGPLPVDDPVAARVVRWDTRFTSWEQGWQTGRTWERDVAGVQCTQP